MTKPVPRINAHIIHAYADGHDVEFCFNTKNYDHYIKWNPGCTIHLGDPRYEWRICRQTRNEDMYP